MGDGWKLFEQIKMHTMTWVNLICLLKIFLNYVLPYLSSHELVSSRMKKVDLLNLLAARSRNGKGNKKDLTTVIIEVEASASKS